MSLKWKCFLDESIKCKKSIRYGATTYVMDVHEDGPCLIRAVFYYSLFLNVFYVLAREFFSWSQRDRGGGLDLFY
jgi:hypothetical protein